jgi:hypothetical protein
MRGGVQLDKRNVLINGTNLKLQSFFELQMYLVDIAIPHQSKIEDF